VDAPSQRPVSQRPHQQVEPDVAGCGIVDPERVWSARSVTP
jgi:hypothetical protein